MSKVKINRPDPLGWDDIEISIDDIKEFVEQTDDKGDVFVHKGLYDFMWRKIRKPEEQPIWIKDIYGVKANNIFLTDIEDYLATGESSKAGGKDFSDWFLEKKAHMDSTNVNRHIKNITKPV